MEDYTLDTCPKCGGEVVFNQCLECRIDLEGWEEQLAQTPSLMPNTLEWMDKLNNDLGLPMYESLKDEDE